MAPKPGGVGGKSDASGVGGAMLGEVGEPRCHQRSGEAVEPSAGDRVAVERGAEPAPGDEQLVELGGVHRRGHRAVQVDGGHRHRPAT